MKKAVGLYFILIMIFSCGKGNVEQSNLLNIYTPNAFFPGSKVPCSNGDPGCNSIYNIIIDKPGNLKTITIQILDEKQNLVYQTDSYFIGNGWNGNLMGKVNGVPCMQGQYYLIVNYTDVANGNFQIKKNIYLMR